MSTYMLKAGQVNRKRYVIDAADKPLGCVAIQAAVLPCGKHRPAFAPHVDCGDHAAIINPAKAVLVSSKLQKKYCYYHTGYVGNLKEVRYDTLMCERPEKAMEFAVEGMTPDTTIGHEVLTRLCIYTGVEYKHSAQKPAEWAF